MKPKKRSGSLRTKTTVKDNSTGRILHEKEDEEYLQATRGQHVMVVKYGVSINISRNYQSVKVDIGLDMPFPIKPGDLSKYKKFALQVEKLVEDRQSKKLQDADKLLQQLGKGRR